MRFQFNRETGYLSKRGFGFTFNYASLGTTYGEPGQNMLFEVTVYLWRGFTFRWSWKRLTPVHD